MRELEVLVEYLKGGKELVTEEPDELHAVILVIGEAQEEGVVGPEQGDQYQGGLGPPAVEGTTAGEN